MAPSAARTLAGAASHAATAVCVHWHYLGTLRPTRRRLQAWLTDLAGRGYVSYSLTGVLRESYALPDRIQDTLTASASPDAARREIDRILRRTRTRARRLLKAIIKAMSDEPNPMTLEQAIARADANPGLDGSTYTCICHGGPRPTPCPGPFLTRAMIPAGRPPAAPW